MYKNHMENAINVACTKAVMGEREVLFAFFTKGC
jgi:hypothetical protein